MNRPSNREIIQKVADAITAIQNGNRAIPHSKHFASDQDDLKIESTVDLWPLLEILLKEIQELGPIKCYAGKRPPEKSYEVNVEKLELWAYSWDSISMDCRMYLKITMKKGYYFYMGCHRSKFQGKYL